jgi:hypothetical protein
MRQPYPQLLRHHPRREGGIDIAVNNNKRGALRKANFFELRHYFRRLGRVRSRADVQIEIGGPHAEILEEDIGHVRIVMLAGMDQQMPDRRHALERMLHRSGLHEVRPRADNRDYRLHCPPPSR